MWLFIIAILIIAAVYFIFKQKQTTTSAPIEVNIEENTAFQYAPQKNILSTIEQSFFFDLLAVLKDKPFKVGYKIALKHLVYPVSINEDTKQYLWKQVGYSSVDFLIMNAAFVPLAVVEIDLAYDSRFDRAEKKHRAEQILQSAGIKVLRISCSSNNKQDLPSREELTGLLFNDENGLLI